MHLDHLHQPKPPFPLCGQLLFEGRKTIFEEGDFSTVLQRLVVPDSSHGIFTLIALGRERRLQRCYLGYGCVELFGTLRTFGLKLHSGNLLVSDDEFTGELLDLRL